MGLFLCKNCKKPIGYNREEWIWEHYITEDALNCDKPEIDLNTLSKFFNKN